MKPLDYAGARSVRLSFGRVLIDFPTFLLGHAEFVKALQVKPELRARAKRLAKRTGERRARQAAT
jgi:hypothetical protein